MQHKIILPRGVSRVILIIEQKSPLWYSSMEEL